MHAMIACGPGIHRAAVFKRIITAWWGVPLLSIGIPVLHTLSLIGLGGPRVTAFGVAAGILLVPLWLVLLLVCRKRWQVVRFWRHWAAGGAAEMLQLVWCLFAALLYSGVVLDSFSSTEAAAMQGLPVPQAGGAPAAVNAPAVWLEQGDADAAYHVHMLLPARVSGEGSFIIRVSAHASGTPVVTTPMHHRITAADRATAGSGVMDITFRNVAVYTGSRDRQMATRWQIFFLPDSGAEEPVTEGAPYLIEGGAG